MSDLQKAGTSFAATGAFVPFTASLSGSQRVNDAHGRFLDAAFDGRLYHGGGSIQAIANATFTTATLGATCTPVVGLYNPLNSNRLLSVLQVTLATIITALQATGPGGFVWAGSTGNGGVSTGSPGFNRRTLSNAGGMGRFFNGSAALTGLTNNLVVMGGSGLGGGSSSNAAFLATAVAMQTQQVTAVENVDGGIIIPPGGVLALLATTTPVAHSTVPGILWEELPFLP